MTEELYFYKLVEGVKTDYTLMDIDKVDIVRSYSTPYFSDVETLKNNGTYTIKIPQTINNKAFFENCHRSDTTSDIPYDYIYADYFYNGLTVFLNAEVKVLDTVLFYEVQCVYGVNRLKYLPLFNKNLNEIATNNGTITANNWLVNWNKTDMFAAGKKYKYIYFTSGERVRDTELDSNGNVIGNLYPAEPVKSCMKNMTQHPFITSENIIDLIVENCSIDDFDTTDLKSKLTNKGLILNTIEHGIGIDSGWVNVEILNIAGKLIIDDKYFNYIKTGNKLIFGDIFSLHIYYDLQSFYVLKSLSGGATCTLTIQVRDLQTNDVISETTFVGNSDEIVIEGITKDVYMFDGVQFDYLMQNDTKNHFVNLNYDSNALVSQHTVPLSSNNKIKYVVSGAFFNANEPTGTYDNIGMYDCLANLPKISQAEFLQQMLIHTCGFLGYTSIGELKTYFFDEFVDNLHNGTVYDWSTRYSGLRKSAFQFNGNAQKNYLKFANDKDLKDRNEYVTVNDRTIESEKDLYVLKFDSPLNAEGETSEYILYEQTVKRSGTTGVSFENKYVGDKWQHAFVIDDNGTAKNINIIGTNYATYQKLIERPIVYECDINLSVYESSNIDFAKPIYIDVLGKYCLLLELQAPNNELCAAKLLLINQIL